MVRFRAYLRLVSQCWQGLRRRAALASSAELYWMNAELPIWLSTVWHLVQ